LEDLRGEVFLTCLKGKLHRCFLSRRSAAWQQNDAGLHADRNKPFHQCGAHHKGSTAHCQTTSTEFSEKPRVAPNQNIHASFLLREHLFISKEDAPSKGRFTHASGKNTRAGLLSP
jgi:hypothetical protein